MNAIGAAIRLGLALYLGACLAGCITTPERTLETGLRYSTPALDPARITVLSWNIQKGRATHWLDALVDHRLDAQLQQSDLVLLQEACVNADGQLANLNPVFVQTGHAWQFATSFESGVFGCGSKQSTGVLIASRAQPLQTLPLRSRHREFGITPKTALAMLFPLAGTQFTLLVINAHLLNFQLFSNKDFSGQLAQLTELIAQHPGPVLFAGDLNTRNRARLDAINKAMASYCLETLLPEPPDTRTTEHLHHAYVLDHILFRGLQPLTPLKVGTEQNENISDHNSIAAAFALARQPYCKAG